MKRSRRGRKLLVASLGVAAMAYACQKSDREAEPVGNLVAPEPTPDAAPAEPVDDPPEPVGNLVPPPPPADGG